MKSSLTTTQVQINDEVVQDLAFFDPFTVYVNPYYVITSFTNGDKVSKHYYMGTQRVATDLGVTYTTQSSSSESTASNSSENTMTSSRTSEGSGSIENTLAINIMNIIGRPTSDALKLLQFSTMTLEQAYPDGGGAIGEEMPQIGEDPGGYPGQERILYWYHPDYIQNGDLVTDLDGEAYELFLYNPWGEQLHHWSSNSSSWTSPYRFNAKEQDPETGLAYYGARYYQSKLGVWLSVDPLASKFPSWTPYHFVHNNPIKLIDPDGRAAIPPDDYIFNEKGDYVRTDINNKPDRIVIENSTTGKVQGTYNFADPSDAKAIDAGTINKVLFVDINRIGKMLGEAGAFDATNRDNEWSYLNTESKGGGNLDFSYSAIPIEFASDGASADPLKTPSSMLFIPAGDSNAHNHMNFGNFLWGAAGHSLGFSKGTLKAAAQYNSLFNSPTNGYPSQWDSADDQFSIGRGVDLSNKNQFRNRTWSSATGLSAPPKKR